MNAAFVSAIFLSLVPVTGSSALEIKPPIGAKPVFTETGNEYPFDTGVVRGTLRAAGKSWGLTGVIDLASGAKISRVNGLFSHYRLLDTETRHGEAAWDWPSTARLLDDGAVEVRWTADAATAMIADGRWQRPPNPVTFKPVTQYAGALGMRRDAKTGLAGLVMAPPADCIGVLIPYGEEGHRSLYLSLFGRDFKDGETATARSRLVIGRDLTDKQAIKLYETYQKENTP
jgi:hypothetical protein